MGSAHHRHGSVPQIASGGCEQEVSAFRRARGDRGIWQPRYWEHTIEDEQDFDRHFDYVHYNPVKHGHVACAREWRASSFRRWVRAGVYEAYWECTKHGPLVFDDLDETAMELGVI